MSASKSLISSYDIANSSQNAAEQLSNSFYSLIPHAFGRNRPPVIQSHDALNKEIELLDSLIDLKDAQSIMKGEPKDVEKVNALDRQFKGLNLDEMTPLNRGSIEFLELFKYLRDTRGSTHNMTYEVTDIFRIERQGEKDRFEKSPVCQLCCLGRLKHVNLGSSSSQESKIKYFQSHETYIS